MKLDEWPLARKMAEFGYPLPPYVPPVNKFVAARLVGEIAYASSVTPRVAGGREIVGKIPDEISLEQAKDAARWCVANSLSALVSTIESARVVGVVDVLLVCNGGDGLVEHSVIADAASELYHELFGTQGHHTRAAIGASSLVRNVALVMKTMYLIAPAQDPRFQ